MTPQILKPAVTKALNELMGPIREAFEGSKEWQETTLKAYPPEVKKVNPKKVKKDRGSRFPGAEGDAPKGAPKDAAEGSPKNAPKKAELPVRSADEQAKPEA